MILSILIEKVNPGLTLMALCMIIDQAFEVFLMVSSRICIYIGSTEKLSN